MNLLYKTKEAFKMARPLRLIKRFRDDEEGATAVEFALIGGPFFLLIFAIIETAVFFLANQYLETVVDDVTRLYRTGQLVKTSQPAWDLTSKDGFDAELCRRIVAMFDCENLITQVDTSIDFSTLPEPPRPSDPSNFSGNKFAPQERFPPRVCPREIVQVTASYEWPIFSNYSAPLMSEDLNENALINVTAVVRTEPFTPDPSSGC